MDKRYISKRIYSKKRVDGVKRKIVLLGVSCKLDVYTFLNLRLFLTIVVFIIGFLVSDFGYVVGPVLGFACYEGIGYVMLDYKIKMRGRKLESEAISFFEILTLALEAGRNLMEAISVTVDSTEGEIRDEMVEVLREVKMGKSLTEAMEDMVKRVPSDSVNNIVLSLTQADLYGSSIIDSLYNQIEYLREKRKMEVKGEISKIPIKISVISVFFFIPLILIIILAPVLLEYIG